MEQESNSPAGFTREARNSPGLFAVAQKKLNSLLRELALLVKVLLAMGLILTILPLALVIILLNGFSDERDAD